MRTASGWSPATSTKLPQVLTVACTLAWIRFSATQLLQSDTPTAMAITGDDVLAMMIALSPEVPKDLSPDADLTTVGIDSFVMIQLTDKLKDDHGVNFDTTELFRLVSANGIAAKATEKKNNPELNVKSEESAPTEPPAEEKKEKAPVVYETIFQLFEQLKLSEDYAKAFDDEGYDDPRVVKSMPQDEFEEVCTTAKMKKGHLKKLQLWKDGEYEG